MKREWFRKHWLKLVEYPFAILLFVFLSLGMINLANDDNWSAISSIATLLLALVALVSILQSKDLRRRELKNRALDDIREWAKDISIFSIAPNVKFAIIQDPKERAIIEQLSWVDFLDSKERLGKYMQSRVNILNNLTIRQSIDDLVKEIKEISGLLLERDSPPLIYTGNELQKVEALNNKALSLIEQLDKYIT